MSRETSRMDDRARRLQDDFERAAPGLNLELAPPEDLANESVGALIVCVKGKAITRVTPPPGLATDRLEVCACDDAEIRSVVDAWETCPPDEILATWDRWAAAETLMVIAPDWLGAVDRKMLEEGIASESFKRQLAERPFCEPREVEIDDYRIVYLASNTAVVTYRLTETYANGEIAAGNTALVLMLNAENRWKVAQYTKHTHGHDLFPVSG